jgi:hypothetical protein
MPLISAVKEPVNSFYTTLSPNPTRGKVELAVFGPASSDSKTIEITTVTGSTLDTFISYEKNISIDMSAYPKGLYILKVTVNGKTEIKKLMVQ